MSFKGNVTYVSGKNLASSLGRKGTESDVTLYNNKIDDTILSFVEASTYPDKIQSLVSALNMADQALLKVESVDASFAETVLTLNAADMKKGYIILGDNVRYEDLKRFIADTVVLDYPVIEEQIMEVRKQLSRLKPGKEGCPLVQIDHSFSVKGVGTVALGVVKQGTLKKYDDILIYPKEKESTIKSIQVHDVDVLEASGGSRVGLALKNINPEDVPRGSVISTNPSIESTKTLELDFSLSRYSPIGLGEGDIFLVNAHLNYVPAKVLSGSLSRGETGRLLLELDKKLPKIPGRILALDPGKKPPRVFAYAQM